MVEAGLLFFGLMGLAAIGGLIELRDWMQARKAWHQEEIRRRRESRRQEPRLKGREDYWAA